VEEHSVPSVIDLDHALHRSRINADPDPRVEHGVPGLLGFHVSRSAETGRKANAIVTFGSATWS